MMVLEACWASLGLLLGALGGLLGAPWGLHIDEKGLTRSDPFRFVVIDALLIASFLILFEVVVSYRGASSGRF